jgi:hypothetical protein
LIFNSRKASLWARSIRYIVHAARSNQDLQEIYGPMVGAVRQLLAACESSGDIHPGTGPEDFLVLVGLLWRIPPNLAGEARVKRLLALVFRGLGSEDPPA